MTQHLERIPLTEVHDLLHVGHSLPFRVLDAQARLLLKEGHVLLNEAQFDSLVERGAWAERSQVEAERAARAAGRTPNAAPPPTLFDRWDRLLWDFDKLTRASLRGAALGDAVTAFFASLQALVERDADVALFLALRHDDQRFALYPLTHSMHCALVTLLTASQLGWPASRIASVGCAALTMNWGMFDLQATMADQDTPPTARQLKLIRAHPEAAVELLRAGGVKDEEWLTAVAQHHEHPDGTGYPHALSDVSDAAQLLRAADVYMAKVSARAHRPAMAPQQASRELFQQRGGDAMAMALIRAVGVHPPGSLLQLRSGEIAVATHRPASGTQPIVATLSDNAGHPCAQTLRRDTSQPEFAVQAPLVGSKTFARVVPERVYGLIPG
jgi:hypothetical protein